ncbi:MAG: hypothetical protein ACREOB_07200, partial [Thermodesulfobacteriota bacterium]
FLLAQGRLHDEAIYLDSSHSCGMTTVSDCFAEFTLSTFDSLSAGSVNVLAMTLPFRCPRI